jgi:hypothetical protein
LVISLLKFALDTAGPDGMSPLSGPYQRNDLPVAEKQSWTPVPPYIPRIQREKLCSASLHVVPTSSPPDAASSWWKAPLWNWKSSSSSSSSTSLSSLSAGLAAAKVQSAETLPAKDPAPLVSADVTPRPSESGPVPNVWATEHSVSRFPSQTLYNQQESIEVQHYVSKRDGVLLAQALAVKQSHNVLSWQIIFSGARQSLSPPQPFSSFAASFHSDVTPISWWVAVLRCHGFQKQNYFEFAQQPSS